MKNTFKFSYLTPTPDTLANIALCRWNDALKGLPAFIQIYMQSQHFLQGFGFSRALSYKEYLNKKITKDTDLKVYVGGYEINLSELLVDHDLDLVKISNGASNLVTFFRITFETEETLLDSNFISHDGTSIPVTEQNITITVELCYSDSTNWNFETQKPLSDLRGNTASALFDMENDDNSDGLYGRDCTLWTTPTEKTIYGSKWQCALPISFLMPDNLSVSNIYFDRQSGEFEALYTVPVVKRFFQNIEKAIYDTHLLNCLHDYNKTEEEINEENNEYIVVGGVNLDENTENLYPVAEDNDHIQVDIAEINSRMVTTHSINSETTGDDQNILGKKSFKDGIKFYGTIEPDAATTPQGYADVKVGIASAPIREVYAKWITVSNILYTKEISVVDETNTDITLDSVGFSRIDSTETFNGDSTIRNNGLLSIENTDGNRLEIHNSGFLSFFSTSEHKVKFNGGVEFNPAYTSGDVVFGDVGFKIKTTSTNNPVVISATGITVGNQTFKIGSGAAPVDEAVIKKTYVNDVIPFSTQNAGTIGAKLSPYPDVYAINLHGVIPYPTSSTTEDLTVPRGGIVVVYGIVALTGRTFTVTANTVHDGTMSGGLGSQYITAGTYVALSSNGSTEQCILAMRIA